MSSYLTNGVRLWERIEQLADTARDGAGGITRMAYTAEDRAGRELVIGWMREAGLQVRVDEIGNIFGRLAGADEDEGAVLLASHIDSVPNGGRFDGPLGVISALEAVQTIVEQGLKTRYPLEVGVLVNEEGARFSGGLLGSRAVVQGVTVDEARHMVDAQGISLYQALADFGLDPDVVHQARRPASDFRAYVELHIEQAAVLESEGLPVGVVTGIAGPLFLSAVLRGRADHAGATPMNLRRDALVGAAELVLAAEHVARDGGPTTVCTVGRLEVSPGAVNVVPGACRLTFDIRDTDPAERNRARIRIRNEFDRVCSERGLEGEWEVIEDVAPVSLDPQLMDVLGSACRKAGQRDFRLVSGAAHDAMHFVDVCPVGMIFVRSVEGISHSPEEFTTPEDTAVGAEVMYHAACNLAEASSCV